MITILKAPNKYTPVYNPVIFQMSSDDPGISFFAVQVTDGSANTITNLRLFVSPVNRSGSYTDLSNILYNTVKNQLLPSDNLIENTPDILQAYQLIITEKIYTDDGIVDGTTYTTDIYYVFNGLIDKVNFSGYDFNNYVVTSASTQASFLTNKPLTGRLYRDSTEYLYFLNDEVSGNAVFSLFTSNAVLKSTNTLPLPAFTGNRIEISPDTLNNVFGDDFTDVFSDEFDDIDDVSTLYYMNISIQDDSGNAKTVTRTYMLRDYNCSYTPVRIVFANQLGGYDSITFFNPREQIDVLKTSTVKNPYQVDQSGLFSDNISKVYNNDTDIINVSSNSTYKAISDPLSDDEGLWLKELIKSKQVYTLLANGFYLPITITNASYPVQQRKYNNSLIRLEILFTVQDTGISLF